MTCLQQFWCVMVLLVMASCSSDDMKYNSMDFIKAGDSLCALTYDTLSKTMRKAIAAGDFANAISVCKKMAPGLTVTYNNSITTIRRTSVKTRNPSNAPDDLELSQINFFQALLNEGSVLKPKLVADDKGAVHYFKPIILQPLCLNCHGRAGMDIHADVQALLKKEYPYDSAISYMTGDLRGLWHITFNPFTQKRNN